MKFLTVSLYFVVAYKGTICPIPSQSYSLPNFYAVVIIVCGGKTLSWFP